MIFVLKKIKSDIISVKILYCAPAFKDSGKKKHPSCPPTHYHHHYIVSPGSHLLLILSLGVEASLDAFPGLLEGLPLGALGGVVGAHSHNVGAGEDQNVGHYLWEKGGGVSGGWGRPPWPELKFCSGHFLSADKEYRQSAPFSRWDTA